MSELQLTEAQQNVSLKQLILSRMTGPGGLYNIGNFVGLASGIGFAIGGTNALAKANGLISTLIQYFIGSPGAIALTFGMVLFFASGELYHRAFDKRNSSRCNRYLIQADFFSEIGALFLAVSLIYFGDILLGLTSTILLAGGKFGNALFPSDASRLRFTYRKASCKSRILEFDIFRIAVLLSRLPAMASLLTSLTSNWPQLSFVQDGPVAILLGCYVLWLQADLLLLRNGS